MSIKNVRIDRIEVDLSVLPRCNENDPLITEYANLRRVGIEFPPIVIFRDADGVHWLADGHKRLMAERTLENNVIRASVRKGDQSRARWFAAGANSEHGQRMTTAECRQAIQNCLNDKTLADKSDAVIADHIGCSRSTVQKVRHTLEKQGTIQKVEKRTGKDGRTRASSSPQPTTARQGRPSTAKTQVIKAKELKDELGQECPEFLRQIIADTQDIKRLLTEHAAIYQRWEQFASLKSGAGQGLHVRSMIDVGKEERLAAQNGMFYCRCPNCWDKATRPTKCLCGGKGKGEKKYVDPKGEKHDKAPGWLTREEYHAYLSHTRGA